MGDVWTRSHCVSTGCRRPASATFRGQYNVSEKYFINNFSLILIRAIHLHSVECAVNIITQICVDLETDHGQAEIPSLGRQTPTGHLATDPNSART